MSLDDAWDAVEAPVWVPEVRVAAQAMENATQTGRLGFPCKKGTPADGTLWNFTEA